MKVTILGAGVGGSHYLDKKDVNQYPPAFLVTWGNQKMLFDCSQGVQNRLEKMGNDYSDIHHIAISHSHPDHCAPIHFIQSVYLKGLWGGERFKNKELTFYGPGHLINNFMTLWNIYNPNLKDSFLPWPKITLVPMSSTSQIYTIDSGKLSAKKVYHGFGKCDAVSYRLETPEGTIAYSGDTGDCDGIRQVAQNADLFICEASARVGDTKFKTEYGHLDPYTVGYIAKNANVKKLLLFHYTNLDSDNAMITEVKRSGYNGEVIAGKDFQTIAV